MSDKVQVNLGSVAECAVRQWMCSHGDVPSDDVVAKALRHKIDEWLSWRQQGLDIVAGSVLDSLELMVQAVKDIDL